MSVSGRALCVLLLAASLVAGACSARKPAPVAQVPPIQTSDIEALIERGCFRCLTQALTLAQARNLPPLAFEAATLLALRSRELGMPAQEWLDQARALAAADPAWTTYLEMVAAAPPEPLSGQRDDLLVETQARNRAQAELPSWRATLQNGPGSAGFRKYLELTLACSVDQSRERDETYESLLAALPDTPVVQYRAGICTMRQAALLNAAQQRDPELVDADYVLGRYALADREAPNQEEALRRFQSAAAAFPSSTSIAVSIGNLYQTWEEWKNALEWFDRVLALMPAHPDALLGRTISLSQLQQHPEAIETATRLIDGRRWFLGQAFYWRAWNHFNMGDNAAARSDADRTRSLMVNSTVYLLSGLIEWRAPRLPSAETEFSRSLEMDFGQCLAALYLGGVRTDQSKVTEAIAALQQARQCFDLSITVHRAAIEKINGGNGTPQSKARGIAKEERLIADAERRREQAVKTIDALERQRPKR